VIHFFTGGIHTKLVQHYTADRINTLNDLIESTLSRIFSTYYPIYDLFKSAVTKDYERIWSKYKNDEIECILVDHLKEIISSKKIFLIH